MNFVKNKNMWLYIVYKKKNGELDIIRLDREKVLEAIRLRIALQFVVSLKKEIIGK